MSTQTQQTVIIQIYQPQRLSNNTALYPFEFMPYLSNREFTPESGSTLDGEPLLPIIKSIGGIKSDCSDLVQRVTPVQVTLDNRSGTFGPDRKFTDELDRFTILNQNMNIYICGDEPNDFSNASDLDGLLVVSKITSIRVDTKSETVTISGETYKTITQPLCAKPYPSLLGLKESAATASLPFIFGYDVYTKLIPLNSEPVDAIPSGPGVIGTGLQCFYGFCTDRAISPAQSPTTYYIRDPYDNQYKEFSRVITPSSAIPELQKTGTFLADFDLDTDSEIADIIKLGSDDFTNRVLTNAVITFEGQSTYTGTVNGAITLEIYKKADAAEYSSSGSRPNKTPIARATVEKTDYDTELVTNAQFNVAFVLDKPVYMSGDVGEELYYSISHDDDDDTNTLRIPRFTGVSANRWRRKTGKNWRRQSSSVATIYADWYVLAAALLDSQITVDESGNRPRYIMVGAVTNMLGQTNFDTSNLDIIVKTDGVTDDASGTVTGSASATLNTIQECLRLLHFTYYPATAGWDSTFQLSWNSTIVPGSTDDYYRSPSFAAGNNALADQVIREVCRQYHTAIVPIYGSFDNVGCFIEGKPKTGSVIITDNEIISSRYEYKDSQNIINSIEMAYEPDLLDLQADDVIQRGGPKGYRYYLQRKDDDSASIAIFGIKPLKNTTFSYMNYPPFAGWIADLLLLKFSLPAEYFEIEVPFEKFYDQIQHFNQVKVFSPKFPSFYGASVAPTLPTYNSEDSNIVTVDEARGQYIRGSVEAIEFVVDANKPATVRYTCKRIRDNDPFYIG